MLVTQRLSDDALYLELAAIRPLAAAIEAVYRTGDCVAPRWLVDTVFDGHRLAREIDSPNPDVYLPTLRERARARVTLTFVTGGARSGKSAFALRLAAAAGTPVAMIATAEARDAEMLERIAAHRRERPAAWRTVEEPLDLAGAAARAGRRRVRDRRLPLALGLEPARGKRCRGDRGSSRPKRPRSPPAMRVAASPCRTRWAWESCR